MHIGVVTEYYYPTLGGVQEHVHHFAKEALSRGHSLKIITSNIKDLSDDGSFVDDIPIERIGIGIPIHQNGSIARVTLAPGLGSKLKNIFEREKFDIIHIHSPLTPTLPILALINSNTVTVGTFHTNFKGSGFFKIFQKPCQRYLYRLDGLIAVSKTAVNALEKYFEADYKVIPNGIDTEKYNPSVPPLPEFNDGKTNLLWVGRIEPRNGLDRMIKAFSFASAKRNDLRLIIVGDGPLRKSCEILVPARLKTNVHFAGFINAERPSYYSSANMLCVPATISSFGITLLEGMAAGKPIVASNIDGFTDVMTQDLEGLLVDTADPREFAEAILKIANDKELAGRYGAAGLKTASKYSWPVVTTQILDYYEVAKSRFQRRREQADPNAF